MWKISFDSDLTQPMGCNTGAGIHIDTLSKHVKSTAAHVNVEEPMFKLFAQDSDDTVHEKLMDLTIQWPGSKKILVNVTARLAENLPLTQNGKNVCSRFGGVSTRCEVSTRNG